MTKPCGSYKSTYQPTNPKKKKILKKTLKHKCKSRLKSVQCYAEFNKNLVHDHFTNLLVKDFLKHIFFSGEHALYNVYCP